MRFSLVIAILLVVSCNSFSTKKTTSEAILKEEIETINWSTIDDYPTFLSCKKNNTKAKRITCFQNTLTQHILDALQKKSIRVSESVKDTVIVSLEVSEIGRLHLKSISISEKIDNEIPELDKYVLESLKTLPPILPAIKRGQHVKTQFKLPIVVEVN